MFYVYLSYEKKHVWFMFNDFADHAFSCVFWGCFFDLCYVRSNGIPVLIVATKQDQCNQSETSKNRKMISEKCNVPLQQIVLFSSKTRRGRDELMEKIETYIR